MNAINPWLDPAEVRLLAERLMPPARAAASDAPTETGFGETFVGFTAGSPATQDETQDLEAAPISPETLEFILPPAPEPEPIRQSGSFMERLQQFGDWLHQQFDATGVFIFDGEGAVIFDESHHGQLHFLARSLALESRRRGTSPGNVRVKIGAVTTVEIIPVETGHGHLVLGTVVKDPLSTESVTIVKNALTHAAAE